MDKAEKLLFDARISSALAHAAIFHKLRDEKEQAARYIDLIKEIKELRIEHSKINGK